jgi:hypothetical protein
MARYGFLTTWVLDAPVDPVWEAIHDTAAWPSWWPAVRAVDELEPGASDDTGKLFRIVWRGPLPYDVTFDVRVGRVQRPHLMEGRALGDLAGNGRWRVFGTAGGPTAVTYEWDVETTQRWMNALAPLARRAFSWNHDAVMRQGAEGLASHLGVALLARG